MSSSIEEVPNEIWLKAQREELKVWMNEPNDSEDWNSWWSQKFENYQFLRQYKSSISTVYEAGCGPYSKNIELIIKQLNYKPDTIILSDPLLQSYCNMGKSVARFLKYNNCKLVSRGLEEFKFSDLNLQKSDITICINVLDHVKSVKQCFEHLVDSLDYNGILILGQDLTSKEDVLRIGEIDDPCHPIRLDENSIKKYIDNNFQSILYKILPRNEGRNPSCHYGTLIFAGIKK